MTPPLDNLPSKYVNLDDAGGKVKPVAAELNAILFS